MSLRMLSYPANAALAQMTTAIRALRAAVISLRLTVVARNASPGAKQPRASGLPAGRHGHTPGLRNKRCGLIVKHADFATSFPAVSGRRPPGPGACR